MDAFDELALDGAVVWRELFSPALIDAAAEQFAATPYGALAEDEMAKLAARPTANPVLHTGDKRYEIVVPMRGALREPALFANPALLAWLPRSLGARVHLNSFVIVVSYPGAAPQQIHRDHGALFADHALAAALPPHAIALAVPLIDLDARLGFVGYWPGSHRWPPAQKADPAAIVAPHLKRGDALIFDYRTIHAGLPNTGDRARPVLYMVYCRPWFFDEKNHKRRKPIDIALSARDELPPDAQKILSRAWAAHART